MESFELVMKQWARLCENQEKKEAFRKCNNCPLAEVICQYTPCQHMEHIAEAEQIIMKWAKENPEPVYPYMIWVLDKVFGMKWRQECPTTEQHIKDWIWDWLNTHKISADLAEKLGVEPEHYKELGEKE